MANESSLHVISDLDSLQSLRFSRPRDMMSVQRFSQRFRYEAGRLEELCRLRPGLVQLNPFAARVQQFMRNALDVVAQRMLAGTDLDEAIEWFKHERLAEFAGRTPEEIVADGGQRLLLKASRPAEH